MKSYQNTVCGAPVAMPVPVMLYMLHLIHSQTHGDLVLQGVSRTLTQAIDELASLQRTAMDVMCELNDPPVANSACPPAERRRLC